MEQHETREEQGFSLCKRIQERLPDLLEGYLDTLTAEAVRAHLAVCYQCSREYREMEQTIRLIESLPFSEPRRDFTPAIMAAIERQPGHSFRSPVVEVETAHLMRYFAWPRTTTGRERRRSAGLAMAA